MIFPYFELNFRPLFQWFMDEWFYCSIKICAELLAIYFSLYLNACLNIAFIYLLKHKFIDFSSKSILKSSDQQLVIDTLCIRINHLLTKHWHFLENKLIQPQLFYKNHKLLLNCNTHNKRLMIYWLKELGVVENK